MHDILTWMLNIYREGYRWGEHEQKVSKYQAKKNGGLLWMGAPNTQNPTALPG